MWHLAEAIALVRDLEIHLQKETPDTWHVALGGGVLHRGESTHDLDIIVIPRKADWLPITAPTICWLLDPHLVTFGWARTLSVEQMWCDWAQRGITDTKHVAVWAQGDRRIDVLVLR